MAQDNSHMTTSQGPAVPSGSRVIIVVSRGPSPTAPAAFVSVPHVVGLSQGDALGKLQEVGLSSQVFNDYSATIPRGEVLGQLPHPGESVPSASEAVLLVSSGAAATDTAWVALPNLVGVAESDAISKLQAVGLSPQIVREYSPNISDGIVTRQLPSSTSLAEMPKSKSSLTWLWIVLAVLLVAALGIGAYIWFNRSAIVPNVVGLSQADATAAINAAGFKVGSVGTTQTVSATEVGKVVAQAPAGNVEQKLTTPVEIVVSGGQKLLEVPNVVGKAQQEAETALKDAGLKANVSQGFSSTVTKGSVISQAPAAGQKVPADTEVGIVVSEGAQNVNVPGVVGQSSSQAQSLVKTAGLGSQVVNNPSSSYPNGQVSAQFPPSGTSVAPGTTVGLIVSTGSPSSSSTVDVPSVVGKTSSAASTAIKNVGLKVLTIQWAGTGQPTNQVVGQVPDSGTAVPKNSTVIIFVSNGK